MAGDLVEYFGEGDECQMAYHFPIMPRLFMALRQEDRRPIVELREDTPEITRELSMGHVSAQSRQALRTRDG